MLLKWPMIDGTCWWEKKKQNKCTQCQRCLVPVGKDSNISPLFSHLSRSDWFDANHSLRSTKCGWQRAATTQRSVFVCICWVCVCVGLICVCAHVWIWYVWVCVCVRLRICKWDCVCFLCKKTLISSGYYNIHQSILFQVCCATDKLIWWFKAFYKRDSETMSVWTTFGIWMNSAFRNAISRYSCECQKVLQSYSPLQNIPVYLYSDRAFRLSRRQRDLKCWCGLLLVCSTTVYKICLKRSLFCLKEILKVILNHLKMS